MQYLFVITYGRSGSTVLMNLLNSIDGFVIRGENNGILSKFAVISKDLEDAHAVQSQFNLSSKAPWFGITEVSPNSVSKQLSRVFVQDILCPPDNTRVIGFKEIRYTTEDISDADYAKVIDFMAREFPDSRFIFNTRNWREVARSGWWRYRKDLGNLRQCIESSNSRFNLSATELGDRAFLIDHADFKRNADGFRPLLTWLGESLSDQKLKEITENKLEHLQTKVDDRGRMLRLRRRIYWWTHGLKIFDRKQLKPD
ncbi:sulfotransferase [Cognatishimia activa]|uniref:Sulfotransferase domain protein n=1 Tax=Cognatishimia activa TaxID=1715691 RepID=A0A0P1IVL4_9RHOB|nr:sulfotransferase [Cognatishimia activa]CUJ18686.1 hypothetical protein TA5113_02574 [Cognatishimia activa]CUK27607.1 hypothetical protein TA5114_03435 [Cognatishimia activa]